MWFWLSWWSLRAIGPSPLVATYVARSHRVAVALSAVDWWCERSVARRACLWFGETCGQLDPCPLLATYAIQNPSGGRGIVRARLVGREVCCFWLPPWYLWAIGPSPLVATYVARSHQVAVALSAVDWWCERSIVEPNTDYEGRLGASWC